VQENIRTKAAIQKYFDLRVYDVLSLCLGDTWRLVLEELRTFLPEGEREAVEREQAMAALERASAALKSARRDARGRGPLRRVSGCAFGSGIGVVARGA
jgi:hypothetical protein